MKRINILLAIVIAVLMTACSESLESKALKRSDRLVDSLVTAKISSYSVLDKEIVYSGDSICVCHFKLNIKDHYGKSHEQMMEYFIAWSMFENPVYLVETLYPIGNGEGKAIQDYVASDYEDIGVTIRATDANYENLIRLHAILLHHRTLRKVID